MLLDAAKLAGPLLPLLVPVASTDPPSLAASVCVAGAYEIKRSALGHSKDQPS